MKSDLINAINRLRGPLRVEAFDHIEAGKPDFMAMIVRDPEPGVSEILAQQLQDQAAQDICAVVNQAADEITALRERVAAFEKGLQRIADCDKRYMSSASCMNLARALLANRGGR